MKNIRLQTLSNYIDSSDSVADIGCDHGYLGILAINKGVKNLQLIDNKEGPLQSAVNNLKKYNFDNCNITFTLSSGLDNLLEDIDTVVMAGMGGHLIVNLLETNLDKAKKMKKIIIQANSEIRNVRLFLNNNSFNILNETIICDNLKYYEIIVCSFDKNTNKSRLREDEIFFGPLLLTERSETFLNKWNEQIAKLNKIKISQKKDIVEIENKINYIKNALKI